MFPYIMSKLLDYFSFKYSRFSVTKSKETTARISLFRELNIPCIYTMEASFCGANQGDLKDMHFTAEHFKLAGKKLFDALIVYHKIDCYEVIHGHKQILELPEKSEEQKTLNLDDICNEFKQRQDELLNDTEADSSAGSDSEPSEDNMSDNEILKILPLKSKRKRPNKLISQNSFKKRQKELDKRLREKAAAKKEELEKKLSKSPVKRVSNYRNILKDRFNLGKIKKVEMVDAWTQTSNPDQDKSTNETIEKSDIPQLKTHESLNSNFLS